MIEPEYQSVAEIPSISVNGGTSFVRVENDDGRLRLRFNHGGRRYVVAVGLPDSKVNRLVAQQKAAQIELDIASGNFDVTLSKYKPPKATSLKQKEVTVVQLFEQFTSTQLKAKELHTGGLCHYTATLKYLERYFPSKPAELIDQTDAEGFAQYLKTKVSTRTVKRHLHNIILRLKVLLFKKANQIKMILIVSYFFN